MGLTWTIVMVIFGTWNGHFSSKCVYSLCLVIIGHICSLDIFSSMTPYVVIIGRVWSLWMFLQGVVIWLLLRGRMINHNFLQDRIIFGQSLPTLLRGGGEMKLWCIFLLVAISQIFLCQYFTWTDCNGVATIVDRVNGFLNRNLMGLSSSTKNIWKSTLLAILWATWSG